MKLQALCALFGVALWGVACGTSPTAVETPKALVPDGDGSATTARVSPAQIQPPACKVAKIQVKAYAIIQLENDSDRRIASLRAEYYDSEGRQVTGYCGEPPVWAVTPLTNDMVFNSARFDPFEARLTAGKGSYLVSATGPDQIYGDAKVSW